MKLSNINFMGNFGATFPPSVPNLFVSSQKGFPLKSGCRVSPFKNAISVVAFLVIALSLTSCFTRENYTKSAEFNENIFRSDMLPKDSNTIAKISWKEFFKDPVLQGHISKALENNLDIRVAVQNIIAAEASLKQSKAALLPTLSAGPGYSFQTQSINTQFGSIIGSRRYVNQFDLTANMSWDVDIWGRLKSQEKAQLAAYLGTIAAHKSVKSELVAAIANNYYQLLTLDEQKDIINRTIVIRNKNLETSKALKIAGILTEVAVQQSQALVYNAQALLVDIDVQIQILENSTSVLLGVAPQTIARTSTKNQMFPDGTSTGYSSQLLSNRPDVMQAEFTLMQQLELKNAARAAFYPSLQLTASGGLQTVDVDRFFTVNSLFASVIGGLTQPIFNGRQIRSNYEISQANQQIAYLNFRKTFLTAGQEVSDALKRFKSQDSFIGYKIQEKDAYQKSVDDSQQLVNYGLANYLEVLNASERLLTAELNISTAELTKMQANIELYRALGGGWR